MFLFLLHWEPEPEPESGFCIGNETSLVTGEHNFASQYKIHELIRVISHVFSYSTYISVFEMANFENIRTTTHTECIPQRSIEPVIAEAVMNYYKIFIEKRIINTDTCKATRLCLRSTRSSET
jgi:hypothetical protein